MKIQTRHILMYALLAITGILFLLSVLIPVERKDKLYANTDIADFKTVSSMPRMGVISDNRDIRIRFTVDQKKLYGMQLFFYVHGKKTDGTVKCELYCDGSLIGHDEFAVTDLDTLMSYEHVYGKEIVFDLKEKITGDCLLVLSGESIAKDTRISLYGNNASVSDVIYESDNIQKYHNIMYNVEILEKSRPYIWCMSLLLAVAALIVYLSVSYEKISETSNREKK